MNYIPMMVEIFLVEDRAIVVQKLLLSISIGAMIYFLLEHIFYMIKSDIKRMKEEAEDAKIPRIYVSSHVRNKNSRKKTYVKGYSRRKYKLDKR